MKEEPFTPSGVTTAEAQPGAPNQTGSPLRDKARQTADSAKSEAQHLKEKAREQGQVAMEQMKSGIKSATHQAQEKGHSFVVQQKENLASKVSQYAQAARSASECLSGGETNMLAEPARKAADQLERVSTFLRDTDPADMFEEVESLARRRPEVVFGGMFIAGLVAARFFKASGERARERRRLRGTDWHPQSYAAQEESIVPVASTPTIPSTPSTINQPTGGISTASTPGTAYPGTSTTPGITGTGEGENLGGTTFPKP